LHYFRPNLKKQLSEQYIFTILYPTGYKNPESLNCKLNQMLIELFFLGLVYGKYNFIYK